MYLNPEIFNGNKLTSDNLLYELSLMSLLMFSCKYIYYELIHVFKHTVVFLTPAI